MKNLPEIKFDDDGYSQVIVSEAGVNFNAFRFYIRKFQTGYIIQTVKLGVAMTGILSLDGAKEAAEALLIPRDELDNLPM